jgi:hypothetical protein
VNISTIQKRKFLLNIYKILYSRGVKPSEIEVRKEFNRYFSTNTLGFPINVPFDFLQREDNVDPDILNELMANSLLNLEVAYECVAENNNELFSVVTNLNSKLENLRSKRRELENKVDQLLFANSNSDGYFYSKLDTFDNLSGIDMNLTTAYVDIDRGAVSIPTISNNLSSGSAVNSASVSDLKYSVTFDSSSIVENFVVDDPSVLFDGLNDTYWSYRYESQKQGVVAIKLNLIISNADRLISSVGGYTFGSSPCTVSARVGSPSDGLSSPMVKSSKSDYSRFLFQFTPKLYSNIELIIYKTEPDRIIAGSTNPYIYEFGLRELFISSSVYDKKGILISSPISIPTIDNSLLTISSVSIDSDSQIPTGSDVDYYIAPDVEGAVNYNDFNWVRISPTNQSANGIDKVVDLVGSNLKTDYIASESNLVSAKYSLIDENTTAQNINDLNPVKHPYANKDVWRIARLNPSETIVQPYILSGINSLRLREIILNYTDADSRYNDLSYWVDGVRSDDTVEVITSVLSNSLVSAGTSVQSQSIGMFDCKLMSDISKTVSSTISKSRPDYNLSVFLNGTLICDLPSGVISKDIEWNFISGVNEIYIGYDKPFSGDGISFSMFSGAGLNEYGIVYVNYISYLSPEDFRQKLNRSENIFTIDTLYNTREIIADKKLLGTSMIRYYSDVSDAISAVRYRVDLRRYDNVFSSPVLNSIRVKFKNSD